MNTQRIPLSLSSLLLAAACTGDPSHATSQTIGSSGGQITVTASTDPVLAGTQLVIPPGAVPDGTVITIVRGVELSASGETSMGPSVRLTPDGLKLAKPATLFVPYATTQPAYTQVLVKIVSAGIESEQPELLVSTAAGLAQFQIAHFSDHEIVARTCPADTTDLAQHPYDSGGFGTVDLAYGPYDLGYGPYDFAYGSYDAGGGGSVDLAYSVHDAGSSYDGGAPYDGGSHYDGGSTDLADNGTGGAYVAPAACEPSLGVTDLAVAPKG